MLLEDCKRHFKAKSLYEVLLVKKGCSDVELKRGYYKQSMKWHPDRFANAEEKENELAKQKFQVISGVYQILSDKEKRAIYDDTGAIADEDFLESDFATFTNMWRGVFKKVTPEEIDAFIESYKATDEERKDLKENYLKAKGNFNKILEYTIGDGTEKEQRRFKSLLDEMIACGELKATKAYSTTTTTEAFSKRAKKQKEEAKEAKEALREMQEKEQGSSGDLASLILARQNKRAANSDAFFDQLAQKYAEPQKKKRKGK